MKRPGRGGQEIPAAGRRFFSDNLSSLCESNHKGGSVAGGRWRGNFRESFHVTKSIVGANDRIGLSEVGVLWT
jgi:hypothetical protein